MKRHLLLTYFKHSVVGLSLFTMYPLLAQQRAITLSGFNIDVVADKGLNQINPLLITTFPLGASPGEVLFEQGYSNNSIPYTNGLPVDRQIVSPSGHSFQLAPYNEENDLRLAESDYGTVVFSNPDRRAYDSLFILAAGVGGAVTLNYLLYYTDNSTTSGSLTIPDWTCVGCTDYAINNLGKIDRTTGNIIGTNQYAMTEHAIHLSAAGRQVYGILFSGNTSPSSVANIFAITAIPASALPVSLVYFNAKAKDASALLQWKTAQELNNQKYIIERAVGTFPDVFAQVGIVPATSSANGSVYNFTNTPGMSGTYLYRLTQQDVDGRKKVLGIRSITIHTKAPWTVLDLGSQWKLTSADAFTYRLIDMNGRIMKSGNASAGTITISKPSSGGMYLIQVFSKGEWSTQKVIH